VEILEVAVRRLGARRRDVRCEDGQALVEYALILGLVCVVAVTLLSAMGTSVTSLLQAVTSALSSAL
jgi:Flp pilus assembly pilin Flp